MSHKNYIGTRVLTDILADKNRHETDKHGQGVKKGRYFRQSCKDSDFLFVYLSANSNTGK